MAESYSQSDSAKHMYSARASNYDNSFHPTFAKHIIDSLNLQTGERLLDLACGTGLATLPAADAVGPTGTVVAVDITQPMLDELQRKIVQAPTKEQYKHVEVYNHDITKLHEISKLEKESFDAISCASALVLLREPDVALQSWAAYLKPGGRLVVDATDIDCLPEGIALERVFHRLGVEAPWNRLWSVDDASLKRVLHQAGLDVEKTWPKNANVHLEPDYYDVESWEEKFNNSVEKPMSKALVDRGHVEKARTLFKEEWEKMAVHGGKVKESNRVWVAIAHKPQEMKPLARGSCACGSIHWTAYAPASGGTNCLCVTCRKVSGSPYITFYDVPLSRLLFEPPLGKPFMKMYVASPHAERGFCGECGSTLTMWYRKEPEFIAVAAGSLDEDKTVEGWFKGPAKNIYVKDVPRWYKLPEDGLERQATMKSAMRLLGEE